MDDATLLAAQVNLSEAGVLANAYAVCPSEDLAALCHGLTSRMEHVTGCAVSVISTQYPHAYERRNASAQSLVLRHKNEISAATTPIVVLLVEGFEKFYGDLSGIENFAPSSRMDFRDARQHLWDQKMVEPTSFRPAYREMAEDLKKKGAKVFCLFHVDGNSTRTAAFAANSIAYSQFGALRHPLHVAADAGSGTSTEISGDIHTDLRRA